MSSSGLYPSYYYYFIFLGHRNYYGTSVLISLAYEVFIEEKEAIGASTDFLIMLETNNIFPPIHYVNPKEWVTWTRKRCVERMS